MSSAWNKKSPSTFASKVVPVPSTRASLAQAAGQAICCIATALLSRSSHLVSRLAVLLLPWSSAFLSADALKVLCWLASVAFAVRSANVLARWQSTRTVATEQDKVPPPQRKLFGLPPPAPRPDAALKQRKLTPPPAGLGIALTPPMRTPVSVAPVSDYASSAAVALGAGAAAGAAGQRPSGFSPGPAPEAIATPEQLRQFLDSLNQRQQPQAPAAVDPWQMPGYAAGGGAYGYGEGGELQQDSQEAPLPKLPASSEAPKYRPSWLPRAKAAVHAPDVLSPSSPDEVDEVMRTLLGVERPAACMEVWVDNLREWLSRQVVQPLVQQVQSAHTEINQVLAQFNQQIRLPPIPEVIAGSVSAVERQPSMVDIDAMVQYVKSFCQALSQQPGQQQATMTLAKAIVRYELLVQLLKGKLPADLLPPVPAGYVWARVQALAEGTCLPAYQWAGGGTWAGRPWSPDLPNDSQLVLYLFAAFIDVPGWEFSLRQPGAQSTRGMPLYLGQLQSRPPNQYSAILAYRPDKPGPRVDAILALNLSGAAPMMCFLVEGRIVALTGYHALFHVIIMFVLYHKKQYNSMLGSHYLHDPALSLAQVVEPPAPGSTTVRKQAVFGCWFPPATKNVVDGDVD